MTKLIVCDADWLWKNRPYILKANTYYWSGFYGRGEQRMQKSLDYVEEVEDWLNEIKQCLEKEGVKNLKVEIDEDEPDTELLKDDEELGYFYISSSRSNVYKKQNTRKIRTLLKNKIGKKAKEEYIGKIPEKELSERDTVISEEVPSLMISKDFIDMKKGDTYLFNYEGKNYIMVATNCWKNECNVNFYPPDEKVLIKKLRKASCSAPILEAMRKLGKDTEKLEQYCMVEKLEVI